MAELPEHVLADLGRVVIRAADLEAALGVLVGHERDLNMMDILGKPGEALRAARSVVDEMPESQRRYLAPWIDRAAELLGRRHLFIHALWSSADASLEDTTARIQAIHMRTFAHTTVDDGTLRQFAEELTEAYRGIVSFLTAKINRLPLESALENLGNL